MDMTAEAPASDGFNGRGIRLVMALGASVTFHLALIFGVQVRPPASAAEAARVLQVRVEGRPPVADRAPPRPVEHPSEAVAPVRAPEARASAAPEPERATESPAAPPAEEPRLAKAEGALLPAGTAGPTLEIPLIEDPTFYPARQLDIHPKALHPVNPVYPDAAAEAGVQGNVVLLLLIDEFGNVKDASVAEASPPGFFEESALAAFRGARFSPAQRHGRVVKSRVLIKVTYELNRRSPQTVQPPLPVP
jgi:protein TonB